MPDLKTAARKAVWLVLYLAAFLSFCFADFYISGENLIPGLIASTISSSIYTFLIVKDIKFWSSLSFFTLVLTVLWILGLADPRTTAGSFPHADGERVYMLFLPLQISFILGNSVLWARTKSGFKRLAALLLIFLSIASLITFGATSPDYYQNFIYTRISLLVLAVFSVFLLIKRKGVLGILGIISVIATLFWSATTFSNKVYTIGEAERTEVLAATTPIAKEMLDYYNKKDYANFCNRCGYSLKSLLAENPIDDTREFYGPYTSLGEPTQVVRAGGHYHVQYPIKFQKVEDQRYLVLVMEGIPDDPIVYGFSFSK